ncbi:protein FAM217A isoform X2 [Panthera leo]|uniref:protein FAM217A isoform X2 n=1 Tax=Panthera leo TaxID=9689 RepID=UPI001C6A4869|nr:protein FAM217A isoform X2 [Panthera leo]
MAECACPPARRSGGAQGPGLKALPWRRGSSRGAGGLATPRRLWAQAAPDRPAAPEYRWPRWNAGPSRAPPLDGSCRATGPLGRPAEPQPQPRLASLGPAWAPAPRRPSSAEGAALAASRRPLPPLSSCCRKAESEGAPVKPFAPHAEGPGPRSSSTFGDDADDDTWACGAMGTCVTGIWIQKYLLLKIKISHLERIVQQVVRNPRCSINKNSKQGMFQLWSYPLNEGSTMENRDFRKSSVETGFNVTNNPIRLFTLNHALVTSASVEKQVGSYPGLQIPSVLCWPYADGDFLKDRNEPYINLCSTIENNSGETLPALNWNLKYGNSSVEENLTDESDLSENEKASDSLLSYFKKMDLNLKPETIVNVEESVTEEPSEVFPYPDFLPSPFNTLDLHKLALSKSENWKVTVEPPESSVERLITRLLEMERLQHMTIQKERPRLQTTFCTLAATERPSSSKAIPKVRQPKLSDPLSLQTTCVDKSREKRKSNSGSCKLEQNASKWNWSNAGKYKWNSRPTSLKSSSTTKQLVATCDDFRNLKSSILNPCQELATKPTPSQTTQSLVKMVSTRCLPPKSPIPVSSIPLSFPENQREEIKVPRTKKKLYQKNIALNRPFYIQKLNCLSPSFTAKDKCSPIDQK